MADKQFALYVSAVKGTAVERLGSRGVYIGATRRPPPEGWAWDESIVVGLTELEVAKYRREYEGMIDRGELVRRSHDDYERANAELEARVEKELSDRKAAEAKAEADAKEAEAAAEKAAKEAEAKAAADKAKAEADAAASKAKGGQKGQG